MGDEGKPRDICKRTFQFALRVVRFCRELERCDGASRTLARQLLRSGTSIGSNVEEAQAGQSRLDFISKYSIALKESRETIYWLHLLHESSEHGNEHCEVLLKEADEIARILGAVIVNTKRKDDNA